LKGVYIGRGQSGRHTGTVLAWFWPLGKQMAKQDNKNLGAFNSISVGWVGDYPGQAFKDNKILKICLGFLHSPKNGR